MSKVTKRRDMSDVVVKSVKCTKRSNSSPSDSMVMDELDVGFKGHLTHVYDENTNCPPFSITRSAIVLPEDDCEREEQGSSPKSLLGGFLDANAYATKKTVAQGMLDVALLTANASQLKYLLQVGTSHEFYHLMMSLICISIILQLLIGAALFLSASYNINIERIQGRADLVNNLTTVGIFLIVAVNIFISVIGMAEWNDFPNSDLSKDNKLIRNSTESSFESL